MNQLIPANFGQLSSKFAAAPVTDDLSSGIQSSFGIIGYKGKVWNIKYRGDETPLMRDDGDGPANSIPVVIVSASPTISKIWYKDGYVEGSTAAPDCYSNNGVTPEANVTDKQCESCALCPRNQWGSRITPAGKQGKECSDSKRLAVVPEADLLNEVYGGPMLLRVPAASLQDLAMYGQKMQQMGYPYYSIATKISFDPTEAYPKFIFAGLRPLNDAEAEIVLSHRDSHAVKRILSQDEFAAAPAAAPAKDEAPLFEQAPDVGAKQNTGVGDQARAAAAAAAAQAQQRQAPTQQAQPKTEPKPEPKKVEPVAPVEQPAPEPQAQPASDMTVAINPRYVAFLKAGLTPDQAKATIEAMGETIELAPEVTTEVTPEPTPAPKKAAKKVAPPAEEAPVIEAEAEQPGVAQASDFEENLDAMLADLLPTLN